MCGPYLTTDSIEEFRTSVNEDYRQLSTRSLAYGDDLVYQRQLFDNRKCGIFAMRLMKTYVISILNGSIDVMPTLRIMQDCVSFHYTGFAFQKYSPFAKLFSWHIRR